MIIGIDGNEANCPEKVGVNQYAYNLLWALKRLETSWSKKHRVIVYLKNSPRNDLPCESFYWQYRLLPGKRLWIITKLMPFLYTTKEKIDVFFTPGHYLPPFLPVPAVCAVMDLGYLKFSEQFKAYDFWQLKLWTAWSILKAKKVFAISETTKKDIVRHYPFAAKKVCVTLLGYDKKMFYLKKDIDDVRRIKKKYSIVNEYVLFIGTLRPSKNVEGLIRAWSEVCKRYPDICLVIAGKKGWLYESIFKKVNSLKLRKRVIFTGFLAEEDKPSLIKGAKAFVMPSFWEGFGIDVVNAMACGVPVVISNQGSLPEIGGEAAVYVNPYDAHSIADGIIKVLSMSRNDYNKIVKENLKWVKRFDWEKTARKSLEEIEKIV